MFAVELPTNGHRPTMEDATDEGTPATVEWVMHAVVRHSVDLLLRKQTGAGTDIVRPTVARVLQTQSNVEHVTKEVVSLPLITCKFA